MLEESTETIGGTTGETRDGFSEAAFWQNSEGTATENCKLTVGRYFWRNSESNPEKCETKFEITPAGTPEELLGGILECPFRWTDKGTIKGFFKGAIVSGVPLWLSEQVDK